MGGLDGNGLQLDKNWPIFSSSSLVSWKNPLNLLVVCFLFKESLDIFPLGALRAFCVREKTLGQIFSRVLIKKNKILVSLPFKLRQLWTTSLLKTLPTFHHLHW